MGNNNDEDYGEEQYNVDFKKKMIDRFNSEQNCTLSIRTEEEMRENEKTTTASKDEKGKNVVEVAFHDDEPPSLYSSDHYVAVVAASRLLGLKNQQQGCSSSSDARSWSPDSPLLNKPLACNKSPSTSRKVLLPLPEIQFRTKRRTVPSYGWHDMEYYQDRANKYQKIMEVKTEEDQIQQRKQEKKKEVKNVVDNKVFPKKEEIVPKKLVKKSPSVSPPPPPPQEMPIELQRAIAGLGETMYLTQKTLTDTDISPHHGRIFLLRIESFMENFLTDSEKENVEAGGKLDVIVVDTEGTEHEMIFGKWGSLNQYVFTTKWKDMVKEFGLKTGDTVQLWIFRLPAEINSKIYFPMNLIRRDESK